MLSRQIIFWFSVLIFLGICPLISSFTFQNRLFCSLGFKCCEPPYITRDQSDLGNKLEKKLNENLFGQHLAVETVLRAIDGHIRDENPSKALVLSFHGWPGSGKTFLSEHIMNSFYEEGQKSPYIKFFMGSKDFPDDNNEQKISQYQEMIRDKITSIIGQCEKALFVFDEIDKTPAGVLDALVPFIDYATVDKNNYHKAIFILMSNTGAKEINKIAYKAFLNKRKREDLKIEDFEETISKGAFNENQGGLYRSRMIDKSLISFYVPFLPLERRHLIRCIKAEAKKYGGNVDSNKIANMFSYWPDDDQIYSTSGCKLVDQRVKYEFSNFRAKTEL